MLNVITPLHEAGKWGMISSLIVDENLRRKQIGAALLAHAEQCARNRGCSKVELSSSESRTKAHAFYERNGYAEKRKRFVKLL